MTSSFIKNKILLSCLFFFHSKQRNQSEAGRGGSLVPCYKLRIETTVHAIVYTVNLTPKKLPCDGTRSVAEAFRRE